MMKAGRSKTERPANWTLSPVSSVVVSPEVWLIAHVVVFAVCLNPDRKELNGVLVILTNPGSGTLVPCDPTFV
jgi:hypothetical protein